MAPPCLELFANASVEARTGRFPPADAPLSLPPTPLLPGILESTLESEPGVSEGVKDKEPGGTSRELEGAALKLWWVGVAGGWRLLELASTPPRPTVPEA